MENQINDVEDTKMASVKKNDDHQAGDGIVGKKIDVIPPDQPKGLTDKEAGDSQAEEDTDKVDGETDKDSESKDVSKKVYVEDPAKLEKGRAEIKRIVYNESAHYYGKSEDEKLCDIVKRLEANPKLSADSIKEFVSELKDPFDHLMIMTNSYLAITTKYKALKGKAFSIIQRACKEEGIKFKDLLEEHGYAPSTIYSYINLAKYENIENLLHLGTEKISVLTGAIKSAGYYGEPSDFVRKHGIDIHPHQEGRKSVDTFKKDVSIALLNHYNETDCWGVKSDIFAKFVDVSGSNIEFKLMREQLEQSMKIGGIPQKYFQGVIDGDKDSRKILEKVKKIVKKMDDLKDEISDISINERALSEIGPLKIESLITVLKNMKNGVEAILPSKNLDSDRAALPA